MGSKKSFLNVLLLGVAFMLIFTAFQTMGNIQKTILESVSKEDPDFTGDGYTSLAIIYAVFAIFNWAAPSVISLTGPRLCMLFGGVTYLLFILSFLIPKTWLLYLASVVIGIGAPMIWTGQGNYLTLNSAQSTISRNSGVFWAMMQMSMLIGNSFVYAQFRGKDTIEKDVRSVVIWTLSGVAVAGLVVLFLLPAPPKPESDDEELPVEEPVGPLEALKKAAKLFATKHMLLLTTTFFYTGIELGFFSGVYSSCLGFTESFPSRKELVGLSGIFIGLGEVIGGLAFGILGARTTRFGRDPIVIGGFIIHIISYFLIFLNLPNSSPFNDTSEKAIIESNAVLALACSFLLGFGDACYNTQIYSMLGGVYADNSSSAFAIFKFVQSVAAAACFFYASALDLKGQLIILLVLAIIGTVSFVWVEWTVKKGKKVASSDSDVSSSGSVVE